MSKLTEPGGALARVAAGLERAPGEAEPEAEAWRGHAEYELAAERHARAEGRVPRVPPTDCEGTLMIIDKDGPMWTARCDVCGFELGLPVMKMDPERLVEHRLAHSGVPDLFRGRVFDQVELEQQAVFEACMRWLKGFKSAPLPAPALWGRPGRGKSHLLCVMVETLIRSYGTRAVYRSAVELFDELQAGFGSEEYEDRWERLLNVDVLAFDDLGAERLTDWRQDRFSALVDHRYAKQSPLLIATNVAPVEWEDRFGDRAASRLRALTEVYEMTGPDRRYLGTPLSMEAAS